MLDEARLDRIVTRSINALIDTALLYPKPEYALRNIGTRIQILVLQEIHNLHVKLKESENE